MTSDKNVRCSFAGKTIEKNASKLKKNLKEIFSQKSKNTEESLHQIRVGSRRIVAAMTIFKECFKRADYVIIKKQLRILRQDIGRVRDTDIQIHIIKQLLNHRDAAGSTKKGIEIVLQCFMKKRVKFDKTVLKVISYFNDSGTLVSLKKALLPFNGNNQSDGICLSMAVIEPVIMSRIDDVLDGLLKKTIKNNPKKIHNIRIKLKKIRYIIEFFPKNVLDNLRPYIEKIKILQTMLGDINDIDTFSYTLCKVSKKQQKKMADNKLSEEFKIGIDSIKNYLAKERNTKIAILDKYHKVLLDDSFRTKLENALCGFIGSNSE